MTFKPAMETPMSIKLDDLVPITKRQLKRNLKQRNLKRRKDKNKTFIYSLIQFFSNGNKISYCW